MTDEVYSFTIRDGRITNQSTVSVVNVPVPDIKIEKSMEYQGNAYPEPKYEYGMTHGRQLN